MLFMTGDIVKYQKRPWIYFQLDEEKDISCLLSIKYSEFGWIYNAETPEDAVFLPDELEIKLLKNCGCEMKELSVLLGKLYERYEYEKLAKYDEKQKYEKMEELEEEMFNCKPSKIVGIRKRWYRAKVEYEKAHKKSEAETKAMNNKFSAITKEYNHQLLDQVQQIPVNFDGGSVVGWNDEDYMVFGTDDYLDKGFLFGPLNDEENATINIVNKGEYFDEQKTYAYSYSFQDSLAEELYDYIVALRHKMRLESQIIGYEVIKEQNRELVHTGKDMEIETYRTVYDQMLGCIKEGNEDLGKANIKLAQKQVVFEDAYQNWLEVRDEQDS